MLARLACNVNKFQETPITVNKLSGNFDATILVSDILFTIIYLYYGKINEEISERTGKLKRFFNMVKSTVFGKKEFPKEIEKGIRVKLKQWRIKGITRRYRIRNAIVVEELNIVPIKKVMEERQLSLLEHVHRMNEERLAREIFEVRVPRKNKV